MKNEYGLWKKDWKKRVGALALCAGMIITGTSVAGAQEHPQFTADQTEIRLAKEELQTVQLSIEEYLKECWKNKQEVIDVSAYKLNEEELNKVIFGIHYENPEYYWVLRNTAINKDEETGFVKTYYQYYEGTTGKPLDRSEELEREWEVVKEKTKYCKTDIEKALVVHEHLCDTIVYSSRLQAAAHDIEGAIFEKEAVCEGYALAYKYYMNRLEIPCKIVSGTSNGQSHAWNQIQLNGNWYMVDPTWDDVANSHDVKHQYFLCSENKFPNHVWNKESELYETCSDTTYDNLDWKNDLQGMYAYQGGLYRSKSLIVGGKEVSGIWRIDAENIEKEAELVLPITDQWQLNSVNVVRGYSQLSYYDGMLYYNTPRAVWRWNFDPESEPEKVFELDQSIPGEIWDAEAANGKIYYETGVYEKGERQKGQYVFDEDYRKAKHPIAVTKPVMTVVMGGENVFLQSAAPGNVTYTSKNPEICDVQVVWKDESCQLIPKKAGETIVTVHADPTDHYAEGAVDVKVIVKERDDNEEHTHNLTLVAAKAATCTTAGNSAYYTCDGCDKWFADATGSVEITDKTSVKIPAPGHTAGTEWKSDDTNHWHECSRCHDKKDEAAHDYGSDNVCDTCGYYKTVPHTHNLTLVAAKAATCTEGGKEAYYKCEGCGKFYEDVLGTKEITDLASWGNIAKIAHTTKQTVTKATPTANGKIVNYCSVCKKTLSTTVIPKASSIKLKATSLTYNGKVRTPKVIVKDRTGKTLVKNTDYTVSYAKGRKYVGKYAVKITFKGKYSGTKMLYFTIKPKATSISSLTAGSKKFTVKWKKQATQTTGYQVQYSASSKFSKAKTVTVGKNTTVSKKISKLSGKKKYYVRVRTYKTVKINGKSIRIYSGWSKAKTVTTKK